MRQTGARSELHRLAAPLTRAVDVAWRHMHWWILAMAVLYAASGTTVVRSDEVAVILRWGRVVGETPALQEHGAGLLFAFPKPIDDVVRVPVKRVYEVPVTTLTTGNDTDLVALMRLDPVVHGYTLTGDHNVVHAQVVARCRIRDAAEWAFYGPNADDVIRVEVTAAMVRSLGEMGVDRVLADGRKTLIATATVRAQEGLDRCHAGLELASLELTRLSPPLALAEEFNAVQSAFIGAETKRKDAHAYAESVIPQAQAEAEAASQKARGDAEADLAQAQGAAGAFVLLEREYRSNPAVVRERLYRDAVDRAIALAGSVRWLPPPINGVYNGLRVTVPSGGTVVQPLGDEPPPTPGRRPPPGEEREP